MSMIEKALEDLSLVEIDIAIAVFLKRFNVTVHSVEKTHCCKISYDATGCSFPFRPSSEHKDGGPLVEEFKVGAAWDVDKEMWVALCHIKEKPYFAYHDNMLAAQMLSILKAHCGITVTVPVLL